MGTIGDLNIIEMILRTTVTFLVLLILARILGTKQLSQLTFFHYITGITIGSVAGEIVSHRDTEFVDSVISLVWWSVLTLLATYVALKWPKARVILEDEPAIVIKEGKILEQSLKKARLHVDDLMMLLREQSIFSVQDVYYAVMETNGQLSVMKMPEKQTATRSDVKAQSPDLKYFPTELITDGKIVWKSMKELQLDEEWLMKKLKRKGVESVEQVYMAQIQTDGSLFVDVKEDKKKE